MFVIYNVCGIFSGRTTLATPKEALSVPLILPLVRPPASCTWVVVKIMVPFCVLGIIRHLLLKGPQRGTMILTTTHMVTCAIMPTLKTACGHMHIYEHVRRHVGTHECISVRHVCVCTLYIYIYMYVCVLMYTCLYRFVYSIYTGARG